MVMLHFIFSNFCSILVLFNFAIHSTGSARRDLDAIVFPFVERIVIEMYREMKSKIVRAGSNDAENKNMVSNDKIDLRLMDMMSLLTMASSKEMAVDLENSIFVAWLAHSSPTLSYLMRKGLSLSARGGFLHTIMQFLFVRMYTSFPFHFDLSYLSRLNRCYRTCQGSRKVFQKSC